jgi:hypothetical protein
VQVGLTKVFLPRGGIACVLCMSGMYGLRSPYTHTCLQNATEKFEALLTSVRHKALPLYTHAYIHTYIHTHIHTDATEKLEALLGDVTHKASMIVQAAMRRS